MFLLVGLYFPLKHYATTLLSTVRKVCSLQLFTDALFEYFDVLRGSSAYNRYKWLLSKQISIFKAQCMTIQCIYCSCRC